MLCSDTSVFTTECGRMLGKTRGRNVMEIYVNLKNKLVLKHHHNVLNFATFCIVRRIVLVSKVVYLHEKHCFSVLTGAVQYFYLYFACN